MGEALVRGLLRSEWAAQEEICVVELDPSRRSYLQQELPGIVVAREVTEDADAVLATKPADISSAARSLAGGSPKRVVSIAAGVRTATIEEVLPTAAVVRAMPNVAALVGASATALCPGARAKEADVAWAEGLLSSVGTTVVVTESLLDSVTGLSGSGPAFVALVLEALVEGGVLMGLRREQAAALALQTVAGTARLLSETGGSPEELRAQVTSPGGTTAAGLAALEARAARSAFIEAVAAATHRAAELGAG